MICFVDYRISSEEFENLSKLNCKIIKIPKCNTLYPAIDGHVDIQISILSKRNKKILIHKNIDLSFIKELKSNGIDYEVGESELGYNYPTNISFNALILDNLFIHNTKYTDKNLLYHFSKHKLINVKQGYTKCSVLPLSSEAAITSDKGIYNVLIKNGIDVLLVPPGDINLPPLDYGFIGGVGGMVAPNVLALFGNLNFYKYGVEVLSFLEKHNITPLYLSNGKLNDRGSLYTL